MAPLRPRLALRIALATAALLGSLLLVELGVRGWLASRGQTYRAADARAVARDLVTQMTELLPGVEGEHEGRRRGPLYTLHPFLGFDAITNLALAERAVEETAVPNDTYDVFVLGGSVAAIWSGYQRGAFDVLADGIAAQPEVVGTVRLYRFATPGHKQPQQLLQLAYLLSRGCRPELVVNLDGLNELRAGLGNHKKGVQPTWPSVPHWARASQGLRFDPVAIDLLAEARSLQREAAARAEAALRRGWFRSAVLGRYELGELRAARARWATAQDAYVTHLQDIGDDALRPFGEPPGEGDALVEVADHWARSSIQLHHLCAPVGVRYLHVLQPTLHDEGSKPISAQERETGFGKQPSRAVLEGYDLLRERVASIEEAGVDVFDASLVFADVEETLYYDNCHFGREGSELLSRAILAHLFGDR